MADHRYGRVIILFILNLRGKRSSCGYLATAIGDMDQYLHKISIYTLSVWLLQFGGLVLVTGSCSKAVKTAGTDLQELNLKGKIKSVRTISYDAVDSAGVIVKGEKAVNLPFSYTFLLFNGAGNLIRKDDYDSHGQIDSRWTYKYDGAGKLTEKNRYQSDGRLDLKWLYGYDHRNNLQRENSYRGDSSLYAEWKYNYNANGRLGQKELNFPGVPVLDTKWTYQYNGNGYLAAENQYGPGDSLMSKEKYRYDKNGAVTEEIKYNAEGKIITKRVYKYNDRGDRIAYTNTRPGQHILTEWVYRYTYDQTGNWIRKIVLENGAPKTIVEREIGYVPD